MKQFHVYSDGKTVKELSWKDYIEMLSKKGFMVGWITDHDIRIFKDNSIIHLSLEQVRKILDLNKQEAKP